MGFVDAVGSLGYVAFINDVVPVVAFLFLVWLEEVHLLHP